jgi:hypothetical protein
VKGCLEGAAVPAAEVNDKVEEREIESNIS